MVDPDASAMPAVVLPPQSPSLYKTFASYSELRRQRVKEESKQQIRQKNVTVFCLVFTTEKNRDLLLGCTSSGDLVVWEVDNNGASSSELDYSSKPIFRYERRLDYLYWMFNVGHFE